MGAEAVARKTEKVKADSLRRYISLNVTNDCNLHCSYCYEHHKNKAVMDYQTALSIIDSEIDIVESNDRYESLEVQFFGGEAFLEFDLIRKVVEHYRLNLPNKNIIFFITTNGTLLNEEIKRWLSCNTDILQCGLSLDGTKKMHDINRNNSFDLIDLDFFTETYPDQGIKMTLSDKTLPDMAEGVIFCHEKGFEVDCNLAFGIDWSDGENKNILKRELNKLIQYYTSHTDIKPCSMLSSSISCKRGQGETKKWCGVGTDNFSYDTYGNRYACQFFMPISIGEEKSEDAKSIVFTEDIDPNLLDEKCRDCILSPSCPTCYGSNYLETGNIYHKNDSFCELVKIMIKARCYLTIKLWEMNELKIPDDEKSQSLDSIVRIFDSHILDFI